jgi:hypothetical protein
MSKILSYLEREHARLEAAIAERSRSRRPDEIELARLKKLKLAMKDQIARWRTDAGEAVSRTVRSVSRV